MSSISRVRLTFHRWRTQPNTFGIFREYIRKPSYIPDESASYTEFPPCDNHAPAANTEGTPIGLGMLPQARYDLSDALGPIPNYSTFLLANWHWGSDSLNRSDQSLEDLTRKVLHVPGFIATEADTANVPRLKARLATWYPKTFKPSCGWKQIPITIQIPSSAPESPSSVEYEVPGFHYRRIVDTVIRILSTDPHRRKFHLFPYYEYVRRGEILERIQSEIYNSDAFIEEYQKVLQNPPEAGCTLERVVIGILIFSDGTILADFGTAKLYPIYIAVANQTKYERCRPSFHAFHDIAYIPAVS
jgi:hypothetical protein